MIADERKITRIYLIRHGETAWSLTGQHTGISDIPLTAHGEAEARALAPLLRHTPFARVRSSPRQRARRTCDLAGVQADVTIEPILAEWDYGDYEGRRTADIWQVRPRWNIFRDGCPHGETPGQVADRADRLIADLGTVEGNIALFSHGQFGCVLAARWIDLPVAKAEHFTLGPATVSILSYNAHHPNVRVIALWNAAPALAGGG